MKQLTLVLPNGTGIWVVRNKIIEGCGAFGGKGSLERGRSYQKGWVATSVDNSRGGTRPSKRLKRPETVGCTRHRLNNVSHPFGQVGKKLPGSVEENFKKKEKNREKNDRERNYRTSSWPRGYR